MPQSTEPAPVNEIVLVGRVAAPALLKELPSGDQLIAFRVIVARGASARPVPEGVQQPAVDTLDCVAWAAGIQRTAQGWNKDDVVEVKGALRRRFYRTGAGAASVWEIEVLKAKRLRKAA
jgi:single-strand DNA-binding protein